MKRIRINHLTEYTYACPVTFQEHTLHLRPREGHDLRITNSRLMVSPNHNIKWYRDVYGNTPGRLTFMESAARLSILSEVEIEHYETAPLDFIVDDHAVNFPFQYDPDIRIDLYPFLTHAFPGSQQALRSWLEQFWVPWQTMETYTLLDRLNRAIVEKFIYQERSEPGVQSPADTLLLGSGSCRDLATLFIEACRFLGIAARFVSGYLANPSDPHHVSTHAWAEVYLPGAGWKGFDSTSGLLVGDDHIATAVSRHPEMIPPVAGQFIGPPGTQSWMNVQVEVKQL